MGTVCDQETHRRFNRIEELFVEQKASMDLLHKNQEELKISQAKLETVLEIHIADSTRIEKAISSQNDSCDTKTGKLTEKTTELSEKISTMEGKVWGVAIFISLIMGLFVNFATTLIK